MKIILFNVIVCMLFAMSISAEETKAPTVVTPLEAENNIETKSDVPVSWYRGYLVKPATLSSDEEKQKYAVITEKKQIELIRLKEADPAMYNKFKSYYVKTRDEGQPIPERRQYKKSSLSQAFAILDLITLPLTPMMLASGKPVYTFSGAQQIRKLSDGTTTSALKAHEMPVPPSPVESVKGADVDDVDTWYFYSVSGDIKPELREKMNRNVEKIKTNLKQMRTDDPQKYERIKQQHLKARADHESWYFEEWMRK